MREENKQTNSNQMFQEKNSFNILSLKLFKKFLTNSNIITITFLTAICIISILTLTNNSFAAFTAQEMEEFQGNEIISGMCYVYKIMNSNLTKALGAAFVMGTGWLFFFGGIKSWHYVLSLSVGVTLIFGGVELANIISRNDYTCTKVIENSDKDENTGIGASAKTTYTIREIDIFSPGQEWKICDKDITNLNLANCESIDENDEISVDDDRDLVLFKCQYNYAKLLDNVYLKYRYNKADKLAGSFILVNSMNTSSTGADSILEQLKCKPSCNLSKLNELLGIYQAETNKTNKGEIVILDNSGKIKEEKYVTMGTKIDLNCLNGLEERDENDKPNKSGLIAICNNGEFEIKGSCKGKCNLEDYKEKNIFTEWQKYNTETKTWVDSKDNIFLYGDKVRIKTCNEKDGYAFETNLTSSGENVLSDNDKLVIVCSSIGNSGVWIPKAGGKSCSKFCRLNSYIHYSENVWRKNCNILDGCTEDLKNGEILFKAGSKLGVVDCTDKSIYSLDTSKKTLRITCNDSKEWEEDNGTRCLKKCNPDKIKFYDYADDWNLCIEGKCSIVKFEKIGELKNGDTIQQLTCKRGYDFNDKEKSTIFSCNDGKFDRLNNYYDEICMPKCYLKLLGDFDNSSYTWIETDKNGNILTPQNKIKVEEMGEKEKSSYTHYFALNECKEGFEKVDYTTESSTGIDNKSTIIYCNEYDTWQVTKQEVKCNTKKCQFDLNTIKANIGETNYNKLGLSYSSQWTEIKGNNRTNYTIMTSNPNYKFDYGTTITLNSCVNSTSTYLFGNKDTTLTCNANGEWQLLTSVTDNTTKRCKTGICKNGPISLIANSAIVSASNTANNMFNADGSQATFNKDNLNNVYYGNNTTLKSSCNSGYFKVGTEIKYTCNNGTWTNSGSCIKVCNGGPTNVVANSTVVSGSGSRYDSTGNKVNFNKNSLIGYYYADGYTIQGNCNSGYTKVGDVKYTCNNGSWNSSGKCERARCNSPYCDGVELDISNITITSGTGITCDSNEFVKNFNIKEVKNSLYQIGYIIQAKCNDGYLNLSTEKLTYTCKEYKHWGSSVALWSEYGSCTKVCKGKDIPQIENISFTEGEGNIYNSDGNSVNFNANQISDYYYKSGYIIKGNCKSGYSKSGIVSYICNNDGTWKNYVKYEYNNGKLQRFQPSDYCFLENGDNIELIAYGAQGGGGNGGYGGKMSGNYKVDINKTLYIYLGRKGTTSTINNSTINYGGGATHIRTEKAFIIIASNTNNENTLIVAGGGGGGVPGESGGGGGGKIAEKRKLQYSDGTTKVICNGGTQFSGGTGVGNGEKIIGASSNLGSFDYIGGGDGWYGGGSGRDDGNWSVYSNGSYEGKSFSLGCGGSGHCGNKITNCSGNNGVRSGDAIVEISW